MATCRICMTNESLSLVPIFSKIEDVFIANMIADCASIQIFEDDGLPTQVCSVCVVELKNASVFIRKCRDSDRKLKKIFKVDSAGEDETEYPINLVELPALEIKNEIDQDYNEYNITEYENSLLLRAGDEEEPQEEEEEEEEKLDSDNESESSESSEEPVKKKSMPNKIVIRKIVINEEDQPEDPEIRFHLANINGFLCCGCFKTFSTKSDLLKHGKKVHSKKRNINYAKKHQCNICYRRYTDEKMLVYHKRLHSGLRQLIECSKCKTRFSEKKLAKRHAKNHPTNSNQIRGNSSKEDEHIEFSGIKMEQDEPLEGHSGVKQEIEETMDESYNEEDDEEQEDEKVADSDDSEYEREKIRLKKMRKNMLSYQVKSDKIFLKETDQPDDPSYRLIVVDIQGHICCGCMKTFETRTEVLEHGKRNHNAKRYVNLEKRHECNICFRRYTNDWMLEYHTKLHSTLTQLIECTKCNSRFSCRILAGRHAKKHPLGRGAIKKPKDFIMRTVCCAKACGKAFGNESELLQHSRVEHSYNKVCYTDTAPQKPFECDICYKRFAHSESLEAHQRWPYKEKHYQCSLCGLNFKQSEALKIHERKHGGEKQFKCDFPQCPKAFHCKSHLKTHLQVHTQLKPFMCSECGVSFASKGSLQSHSLVHKDEYHFKCTYCPREFKAKQKLIIHMRTHTGEKPHKCKYCDQGFADPTNKMRHEMSHTGYKPYKCRLCDRGFVRKRFLADHERTHGVNPN